MEVRGKRKFIAFLVTIGMFFVLMSFMIFLIMPVPSTGTEINALGTFSGLLGGALMIISGAFYAGNAVVHRNQNKKETQ